MFAPTMAEKFRIAHPDRGRRSMREMRTIVELIVSDSSVRYRRVRERTPRARGQEETMSGQGDFPKSEQEVVPSSRHRGGAVMGTVYPPPPSIRAALPRI